MEETRRGGVVGLGFVLLINLDPKANNGWKLLDC